MRAVTTSVLSALGWFAIQASAVAQNQSDFINIFGTIIRQGISQAVQASWRELPRGELACLDERLRAEGTSIAGAIQEGMGPSDPRFSAVRSTCQSREPRAQTGVGSSTTSNPSIYGVEGLAVGGRVVFNSAAYREYSCTPSEQFAGHSWCRKRRDDNSPRGAYVSTYSILHAGDGTVSYVNRSLDPAWFSGNEANEDIARLAKKFGTQPRLLSTPRKAGLPNGIIASWGDVSLDPLDQSSLDLLASGQSVRLGIMVDHLGDFQRSAKSGLPVYKLGGGAGYVWAANWDDKGRGSLRFLAINASMMSGQGNVQTPPSQQAPVSTIWPPVTSSAPPQSSAFNGTTPSSSPFGPPPVLAPQKGSIEPTIGSKYRMESGRAVVTVTGYGATPSEARNDAVRQAVQKTMQQLIVVDRVIKNDEIVRDKIMSTMNGYVEGFKELSLRQDGNQTVLEAEVTVSPTKIENFIGQSAGNSATIDGGTLQQESERELSQRKARGELFDRLFKGFPSEVLKPRMVRIVPSEKDPSAFVVTVEVSYSPAWISALRSGLKGIAIPEPTQTYPRDDVFYGSYPPQMRMPRSYPRNRPSREDVGFPRKNGVGDICFDDRDECYRMPAGNYGGLFKHDLYMPALYLAIKFVDVSGKSVHLGERKCIIVGLEQLQMNLSSSEARARTPWFIDTRPLGYTFPLPPSSLNIGEAKKVVLLTTFGSDRDRAVGMERRYGRDEMRRIPVPTRFGAVTDILEEGVDSDVCSDKMDGIGEQAIGAEVLGSKQ